MMADSQQEITGVRLWWTRLLSRRIQFVLDITILLIAFVLAYLLRFDFVIPPGWSRHILIQLPYVMLLEFVALNLAGAHSFVWRYVGIAEVKSFFIAGRCVFSAYRRAAIRTARKFPAVAGAALRQRHEHDFSVRRRVGIARCASRVV